MKNHIANIPLLGGCAAMLLIAGCATSDSTTNAGGEHFPSRYLTTDGRTIEIGTRSAVDDGWSFREPHMNKCWIANGFNFDGYDTLYIVPTLSTAKLHGPDEEQPHALAKENLVIELKRSIESMDLFPNVVTRQSDIKPGARVLKLENTIVEYAKGGGAARYFVGLYGGGQPVLRVDGKMIGGNKTVFTFEARRSGVSAGAHMVGAFMTDVDIQTEDIRSMALDLTDFMAAIAGKHQPKD